MQYMPPFAGFSVKKTKAFWPTDVPFTSTPERILQKDSRAQRVSEKPLFIHLLHFVYCS